MNRRSRRLRKLALGVLGAALSIAPAGLIAGASASANETPAASGEPPAPELIGVTPLGADVQRFHYRYGPLSIGPGQNLVLIGPVTIEKPDYPGYMVRFRPDLVRADGVPPNVDEVHLHHSVWLNMSADDLSEPGLPERFFAAGEEKTIGKLPPGYGYPVRPDDVWTLNHMIHNQTAATETVWITYDIDFVPLDSDRGQRITPVRPLWLDVQNGRSYPVFDVHRGTGGADDRFTYPREAQDPYGDGPALNGWTAPGRMELVGAAGHVHPGGLWTDLAVSRGSRTKRIFRSKAHYFDRRGPISWDMAMTATRPGWRVGLRKGDRLSLNATYDTKRASWYESMGIDLTWVAEGKRGPNPFKTRIPTRGRITHGHLPENGNHGGAPQGAADPRDLPDGQTLDNRVGIFGFQYLPGGAGLSGGLANPPTIPPGGQLRFDNGDSSAAGTMHSITACKPPCNRSTGISYPLANGPVDFDSGNLGYGPSGFTAAANTETWQTPTNLPPGTYTYFCRIHPFMRGAFRVAGS